MKSKIVWRWAALISLSLFFIGCKKEIKQTEADKLMQDNGSSSHAWNHLYFKRDSIFQNRILIAGEGTEDGYGPLGIGLANKVLIIGGY